MSDVAVLRALRSELECELTERILPYWLTRAVDQRQGGFVGFISGDEVVQEDAPKGAILNARILWTFAAAYRALARPEYGAAAERAAGYMRDHFLDPEHGGVYWMVDAAGAPLDARKHVYAQAFAIYALSEHARALRDPASLRQAIDLYRLVEQHAADPVRGGYQEAFSREWTLLDDVRLSDVDADERRSMNTHLHLLEAYAALVRVWDDPAPRARLRALIQLFLDHILDPDTAHLQLFFDDEWRPRSHVVSFGHDIEASWLLLEAADVLGDDALRAAVHHACLHTAQAVLRQGVDPQGGLYNEAEPAGVLDTDKEWWPQAEAIVGFLNAYQETGRREFLDGSRAVWAFTRAHISDRQHGEWFRRVARDGSVRPGHEKVGPWKCPYHDARACLEVMARVDRLAAEIPAG